MSRILSTLPQEYFEFKSVWESVPVSDRSVNLLVERLRLIEMRLPDKTNSSSVAFAVKADVKKERNKKRGKKCFNCHQNGHFAKSCPMRQNGNKEQVRQFKGGETFFCYRVEANSDASAAWLADSGASHHMTWNKKYFTKYVPFPQHVEVRVGNGEIIYAYGRGTVRVKLFTERGWLASVMEEVWYVPRLGLNLFSIGRAAERGFTSIATADGCYFRKNDRAKLVGARNLNGLYELKMRVRLPKRPVQVYVAGADSTLQLWHERLCHQNKRHVCEVLKNCGIEVRIQEEFCTGCTSTRGCMWTHGKCFHEWFEVLRSV
ncbi:zinc knuckle [Trichuris suis]|nr:zinc knuckle [Trichuris suis]